MVLSPPRVPIEIEERLAAVGKSPPRVDALEKVKGETRFTSDLHLPGMLHGKVLRSRYPHARIKGIYTSEAERLPGVVVVATAKDVPGRNAFGRALPDQPVVAGDKVRFRGDAVALVAAESEQIAEEALQLIRVEYEELPALFDPREALEPSAPLIHERGNLLAHIKIRKGDVEQSFPSCDVIVENTYRTQMVEHLYLEVENALAVLGPDGVMTVWGTSQAPFNVRQVVANVLGFPVDKVRILQTQSGGGFGGKTDAAFDVCSRTALLAYLTRRPVKMVYSREESIVASSKRNPMIMEFRTGAAKDGRLLAAEARVYINKGAYASVGLFMPPAGGLPTRTAYHSLGPYVVPNVKVDVYSVYTNQPYGGPMRGYGQPQVAFAHESQMDELAARLGMDPLELRLRNGFEEGSETHTGQILDHSVGLKETMRRATEAISWEEHRRAKLWGLGPLLGNRRGMGMGCCFFGISSGRYPDFGGAHLWVAEDGRLLIGTGAVELGQGMKTALTQIAADALGASLEDVVLTDPDTQTDADSQTTTASRVTTLVGNAIVLAAAEARRTLTEMAAQMLEGGVEDVEIREGLVSLASRPDHIIPLREVGRECYRNGKRLLGKGVWQPPRPTWNPETGQGRPCHAYAFATQVAEVEVDTETGQVKVLRIAAAHDVGKAVHPIMIQGQIEGGVSMGLGYALTEEVQLERGMPLNTSLATYLSLVAPDTPEVIPIIVEERNRLGPFGAKGVGEPPAVPTAAAIANAIYDAIGVRIKELPATPERVLQALKEARA